MLSRVRRRFASWLSSMSYVSFLCEISTIRLTDHLPPQSRFRSEIQHLQTSLDASKSETVDLKRRLNQMEREFQTVAASDHTQTLFSPSSQPLSSPVKSFPGYAPTVREPQPRRMQESRVANALPDPPSQAQTPSRSNGSVSQGPYGHGYGGVHASRSASSVLLTLFLNAANLALSRLPDSVDFKRASLQFAPAPAGPNSPRRRNYE